MAHAGRVPFRYVVAAGLSGNRPDCLDAVEACVGVTAVVAIPAETHGWLQAPRPLDKPSLYTGEVRSQRVGVGPEPAPGTVAAVAAHLPASQWYRRTGSEGTKGPIE